MLCDRERCNDDADVARLCEINAEVYHYCEDHDPLPSEGFSEVDS